MDLLQNSTPAVLLVRIVAGGAHHGLQREWQMEADGIRMGLGSTVRSFAANSPVLKLRGGFADGGSQMAASGEVAPPNRMARTSAAEALSAQRGRTQGSAGPAKGNPRRYAARRGALHTRRT